MDQLAHELATLSASEMVAALGVRHAPELLRKGLAWPFYTASRSLGEALSELDGGVVSRGLPAAAAQALTRFGVALRVGGAEVGLGPRLVLANHPGAYDALALMTAIGRKDLLVLAADRNFLRGLPNLSTHFAFVGENQSGRAGALKRALSCLKRGGAVLHFPAGQIEPDADFEPDPSRWLLGWQPGVSALVRACERYDGRVLVAGVRGVHSPRAKRFLLNRVAERRGITTLSPLIQMVGKLRDVTARVWCQETPLANRELADETRAARLRSALKDAIAAQAGT